MAVGKQDPSAFQLQIDKEPVQSKQEIRFSEYASSKLGDGSDVTAEWKLSFLNGSGDE